MDIRDFTKIPDQLPLPNLVEIQTRSYREFLQTEVPPKKRANQGLEAILREIFAITSFDGNMTLEYLFYELDRPRYTPDECRQLRLTYGLPFKVWLRLKAEEAIEESVYLGDMPVMLGGGEFIINGAERVIVSQLHRSEGIDFFEERHTGEKRLHSCRIIPQRGSWIEMNVSTRDVLVAKIDQSGKMPVTCFLRAMDSAYSTDADIIRLFYQTQEVPLKSPAAFRKLRDRVLVGQVVDKSTGEVLLDSGDLITETHVKLIKDAGIDMVEVIADVSDPLILNTLSEDKTGSHEEAVQRIYARLRPGNPVRLDKAKQLFTERFFDANRYRLGKVGRFRLNRKLNLDLPISDDTMTLRPEDLVEAIRYILLLRKGEGSVDDIDHLGNRRIRTVAELGGDEIRKGFLKLRRTVQERMSLQQAGEVTPRTLVNSKTISAAIDYFFGRSELSQVVDQHNPLSQLNHERRLSALGPGGLNRKRAGFEVRDVHISHYGRICPIETPEGPNIGLITSLGTYARVDEYGFLVTPYRKVKRGRLTAEVVYLRANDEDGHVIAPADVSVGKRGVLEGDLVMARRDGEFSLVSPKEVEYMDVSPRQLVGISASLIPFLEHNDANRALMGSNMQRQAVPLLITEPPIVVTGMERAVAENSGMVVRSRATGIVERVTADEVVVGGEIHRLRKFVGLNEKTCLNQKPLVTEGQKVKAGQIIADGASTHEGELALGRNVLVAFMPWEGYNFEDAILISQKLVKDDRYTSIHIEKLEAEIRDTKLGREEFTRDIPNVSERALQNLDKEGIVQVGTRVGPGDILVGKVAPKSKSELTPEEKLLHAIFGRAGEDVKNESLEVPADIEGIVVDTRNYTSRLNLSADEKKKRDAEAETIGAEFDHQIAEVLRDELVHLEELTGKPLVERKGKRKLPTAKDMTVKRLLELEEEFDVDNYQFTPGKKARARQIHRLSQEKSEQIRDEKDRALRVLRGADVLPNGALAMVKVYVATKRTLSVGDKLAGRHGNKGVIARILPEEDMPFLEDGTPVEMVLNPLGVPSRMNVGQVLETHLAWAAKALGFRAISPVFGGATEDEIRECLKEAGLPEDGKAVLHDGRTGEPFQQRVTVGYMYIMKLIHLADDKIHARATGPYSLITQQPLGGKARFGGQRFGEMEVWALEAYGAANVLQEMLTVKSDDVEGRTKTYESIVKGENSLEAGTPASFDVLTNEIRGLALNLKLEKKRL